MTKPKPTESRPPAGATSPASGDQPNLRNNPQIDAKIDSYIQENPKFWAHVQGMPRERLERTVVLNEVRAAERQQRTRDGTLQRVNNNPALKQALETLVKDLPEAQRENAIAQLARQAGQLAARSRTQEVPGAMRV
ncbi:MAG: hypothetical protein JNK85_25710 [Verrucomicrobiales bacterium]|nr:hypothetical protein [Verrucomicrobiales bacterium]